MEIVIRNSGEQPIYEQIFQQIKTQIIAGELKSGEALPSIRALAKDLRISVITTKRAYDELEASGFINNIPGKGCFVARADMGLVREHIQREIEEHISAAVELSRSCELSLEELTEILNIIYGES
ncbi:MAG: GntR family transcriptional regulator [Eubacteriales bacterium]|nr:GntR family transcriptional regulator [Eubacteriales bacterium]